MQTLSFFLSLPTEIDPAADTSDIFSSDRDLFPSTGSQILKETQTQVIVSDGNGDIESSKEEDGPSTSGAALQSSANIEDSSNQFCGSIDLSVLNTIENRLLQLTSGDSDVKKEVQSLRDLLAAYIKSDTQFKVQLTNEVAGLKKLLEVHQSRLAY